MNMNQTTPEVKPIPGFSLRADNPAPRLSFGPDAPPPVNLVEKHRPRTIAEMVGQGWAALQLTTFLEQPYSCAFFFEGPTGVGKTTAALALAAELGAVEYGGLHEIKSGAQDADSVETALDALRYTPMLGSGWKVVIVDEADYASPKARQLWLSALEDLPARSVIIFTTNHAEKFEPRLLDRCERIKFASDGASLLQDAQTLVNRVWHRETGHYDAPSVATIPGLVAADGSISFRRAVAAVAPMIRAFRSELARAESEAPTPEPTPEPISDAPPSAEIPAEPPAPISKPKRVRKPRAKVAKVPAVEPPSQLSEATPDAEPTAAEVEADAPVKARGRGSAMRLEKAAELRASRRWAGADRDSLRDVNGCHLARLHRDRAEIKAHGWILTDPERRAIEAAEYKAGVEAAERESTFRIIIADRRRMIRSAFIAQDRAKRAAELRAKRAPAPDFSTLATDCPPPSAISGASTADVRPAAQPPAPAPDLATVATDVSPPSRIFGTSTAEVQARLERGNDRLVVITTPAHDPEPSPSGGEGESRPVTIEGKVYQVTPYAPKDRLRSYAIESTRGEHEVSEGADGRARCTCGDFVHRHAPLPTSAGCRHVRGLVALGLVVNRCPEPPSEVSEPAPTPLRDFPAIPSDVRAIRFGPVVYEKNGVAWKAPSGLFLGFARADRLFAAGTVAIVATRLQRAEARVRALEEELAEATAERDRLRGEAIPA